MPDNHPIKEVLYYFVRGLLFVFPLGVTIWIILAGITWIDGLIPLNIPGLGIIIIMASITLVGYLVSFYLSPPLLKFIDGVILRMPLVNIIYSSIKDLTEAFIGEKKRFTEPVLVDMSDTGIQKLGFVTRTDLEDYGMAGKMAVYFPHSYNFSGNLFIVPAHRVHKLDVNASETMKFIVSGGITGFGKENEVVLEKK